MAEAEVTRVPVTKLTGEQLERLTALVVDVAPLFNATTADEVNHYLVHGNYDAVAEVLTREALIHESCMSQGRADSIYAVCERIGRAVR